MPPRGSTIYLWSDVSTTGVFRTQNKDMNNIRINKKKRDNLYPSNIKYRISVFLQTSIVLYQNHLITFQNY